MIPMTGIADNLVDLLVLVSLKGSVLVGLVFVLTRLKRKIPPSFASMVWLMSLVSFILIPVLYALLTIQIPYFDTTPDAAEIVRNSVIYSKLSQSVALTENGTLPMDVPQTEKSPVSAGPSELTQFSFSAMYFWFKNGGITVFLAILWGVGFLLFMLKVVYGHVRFALIRRNSESWQRDDLKSIISRADPGYSRKVDLQISSEVAVPVTSRLFRPCVVFPESMRDWTLAELRPVLYHELAHIKRLDYLKTLLVNLVIMVYWFNPVVWFAVYKYRIEVEKACDDLAISSGTDANYYAQQLLEVAKMLIAEKWASPVEMAMARKSSLEGRILSVLETGRLRKSLSRKNALTIAISGLLIIAGIACMQFKADTFTVEMIDGVKFIHNTGPAWCEESQVKLEFVQKIGELEPEDTNYQFFKPRDVERDDHGNIYILDSGNFRVQKFDKNGKFVTSFGRSGQGPGEFGRGGPMCLNITGKELWINDPVNRRIVSFSFNGESIRTFRVKHWFFTNRLLSDNRLVFQSMQVVLPGEPLYNSILYIEDTETDSITEISKLVDYGNQIASELMQRVNYVPDKLDNIVTAYQSRNLLMSYSTDGSVNWMSDRPLEYELAKDIEDFDDDVPVSKGIGIDNKDRIWVSRVVEHGEKEVESPRRGNIKLKTVKTSIFEIFDLEGVLLGYVRQPENGDVIRVLGDRVFFIDTNERMCVFEYRIVRN